MSSSPEIVQEFLRESHENLDRMSRDLVALEASPADQDMLASIYRTLHTVKSSSALLGFASLVAISHAGEDLLSVLREDIMDVDSEIITTLLHVVDAIRLILTTVEETGDEGGGDFQELVELLREILISRDPTRTAGDQASTEARPLANTELVEPKLSVTGAAAQPRPSGIVDSTIRVDVRLLDKLMNLVGELVLARNQLLQFADERHDSALVGTTQNLNLITTELQGVVMKTRMQAIDTVWSNIPRLVRDQSISSGKSVRLEMAGGDTELDKTIIEAIKDPLTHVVRNAIDHGIEMPDKRVEAGKPREGIVELRAFQEGGYVNIEVSDDGRGLDFRRLRERAVGDGVVSADAADQMSETDLGNLIFRPGFSTAHQVTDVSGRGVGMDVVKANVEKVGGSVRVVSEAGCGTQVHMRIPLTLAIIPALVVVAGADRYAIPQVNLVELVHLDEEQVMDAVHFVKGTATYRLRGHLLPLVDLDYEMGNSAQRVWVQESVGPLEIVVLQAEGSQFGLVVHEVCDTEEIVVKPLSQQIKELPLFAGATIMGDGRVALILDVVGLAKRASVALEAQEGGFEEVAVADRGGHESEPLLLVSLAGGRRLGVPLTSVSRLEEFGSTQVEIDVNCEVVQYRGDILPLADMSSLCGLTRATESDNVLQVVVVNSELGRIGMVVGEIVDIIDEPLSITRKPQLDWLRGSALVSGKVTGIIDIEAVSCHLNEIESAPAFSQVGV